jgi:hypothetical protein
VTEGMSMSGIATTVRRLVAVVVAALAASLLALPALPASADAFEDDFASRINGERTSRGVHALAHVQDLQDVARRHAQRMAAENRLYHNPNLSAEVHDWSRVSENVGFGPDVAAVHSALMNSTGHRANILDRGVSQVGIGVAWNGSRLYVTQVFRQPTGAAQQAAPVGSPTASSQPSQPAAQPQPAPQPGDGSVPALCNGVQGTSFADVPADAWFAAAVTCATGHALAYGIDSRTYGPGRTLTRGQMASFVYRLVEKTGTAPGSAPDRFRDDVGSPHERAINVLAEMGVIAGTGPSTFSPTAPVTRGQTATLLARMQEKVVGAMTSGTTPFNDIAGNVHAETITKVYTAGIAGGTSSSTFSPNVPITRDHMTAWLVRSFGELHAAGKA